MVELDLVRETTGKQRHRLFTYHRYLNTLNRGMEQPKPSPEINVGLRSFASPQPVAGEDSIFRVCGYLLRSELFSPSRFSIDWRFCRRGTPVERQAYFWPTLNRGNDLLVRFQVFDGRMPRTWEPKNPLADGLTR